MDNLQIQLQATVPSLGTYPDESCSTFHALLCGRLWLCYVSEAWIVSGELIVRGWFQGAMTGWHTRPLREIVDSFEAEGAAIHLDDEFTPIAWSDFQQAAAAGISAC